VVRAPARFPLGEIERFVMSRQDWLNYHLSVAAENAPRRYENGERFWYRGQQLPLAVSNDYRSRLAVENGSFIVSALKRQQAPQLFKDFYRREAERLVPPVAELWSPVMELPYQKVSFRDAATRWGSCSENGTLSFSIRLAMVRPSALEYVVIHELAHLRHLDHGRDFWNLVGRFCPGYRDERRWLRDRDRELTW
jgi:predicted metal-dependent hydrolase